MSTELDTERKRFHSGLIYSSLKYGITIVSAFTYSVFVSRLFGANLIGVLALLMTFIGVFGIISNLGEQGGLVKLINKYKADNPAVTVLVFLFLCTSFTVTAVLSVPFVLISRYLLGDVFHQSAMIAPFCVLSLSYLFLNNTSSVLNNVYVAFQEMRYALIIEACLMVVKIASVFLVYWYFGKQLQALVALQVILDLFNLILAVLFLSKVIGLQVDFTRDRWKQAVADLKEVLVFGFKLIPKNYNYLITEYMDRILIPLVTKSMLLLGLYVTAYQVFSKIIVFTAVFCRMLFPSLTRMQMETQLGEMLLLYNESIKKLLIITTFIVAFCGSFALPIMGIFGPEFKQAHTVLLLLLPGLLFETFSITSATLLQAFNRPGIVSIYCFVGTAANLLLNLVLIPVMGIEGAAIANTSGLMMMAVALYANACRIAKCSVIDRPHALIYLRIILIGSLIFTLGCWTQQFSHTFPHFLIFATLYLFLYLSLLQLLGVSNIQPLLLTLVLKATQRLKQWQKIYSHS